MLQLNGLDTSQLCNGADGESDNSDNDNVAKFPISNSLAPKTNDALYENGEMENSDEDTDPSNNGEQSDSPTKSERRSNKKKKIYDEQEERDLEELIFSDESENQNEEMENNDSSSNREQSNFPARSKRRRNKKKKKYDEQEERNIEKLIFGDEKEILENYEEKPTINVENDKAKRKPVWMDEDDKIQTDSILFKKKKRHQERYTKFLEDRFVNTYGEAKWAQLDKLKNEEDSDDEMLQRSGKLLGHNIPLPKDKITLTKCSLLNGDDLSMRIIRTVQFHPMSQVALVACVTGKTTIFQVDGKTNSKIQSIQFDNFPIDCANFSVDGEQIIVGSRKYSHFYYYHMLQGKIVKVPWDKGLDHCLGRRMFLSPDGKFIVICGRFGYIHLLSAKTKEWICQLKMNDEVYAIAFSPNGKYMYSHGRNSQIYIWDLESRLCVGQFFDEGCITGTCLAVSPNDQYLAAGSDTGVVNVYEIGKLDSCKNPKPIKNFMNITTEVTSLKFNHSSEILAMASNQKDEAVKLAHFPSMTVFSNFPLQHQKHYHVNSLDISLNSGYLSIANNRGKAFLYRIKKYENY